MEVPWAYVDARATISPLNRGKSQGQNMPIPPSPPDTWNSEPQGNSQPAPVHRAHVSHTPSLFVVRRGRHRTSEEVQLREVDRLPRPHSECVGGPREPVSFLTTLHPLPRRWLLYSRTPLTLILGLGRRGIGRAAQNKLFSMETF